MAMMVSGASFLFTLPYSFRASCVVRTKANGFNVLIFNFGDGLQINERKFLVQVVTIPLGIPCGAVYSLKQHLYGSVR